MTDNIKVISKPKVRFCQFSDNTQNKTEIVEDCKQQTALQANGPKIKEIVTLKKPIRVFAEPTKFASVCDEDLSLSNRNIDTLSHYVTTSGGIRNKSNKSISKVESKMILRDANDIQNIKNNCKMSQLDKSPHDDILKDDTKNLSQKGKENKDILFKRSTFSRDISDRRTVNFQPIQSVTREKFKLSTGNNYMKKVNVRDFKKLKMTKSVPSVMKKIKNSMIEGENVNVKAVSSQNKTVVKNKISPVKKIILRNVSGPKIKTSVRPRVFRKERDDVKTSDANVRCTAALDVNTEDLAQPEYNSIMCTINKLKGIEQQNVVTDINHLQSTLKCFLNGKISAALDFPLDETIYKNLIDLSIDEKQLPSIVMRSKDPEPRQKDIIPKLSDFFIPEDTKEICEVVYVKSWTSKIDNNWDAFKISDRILEWKCSIDD